MVRWSIQISYSSIMRKKSKRFTCIRIGGAGAEGTPSFVEFVKSGSAAWKGARGLITAWHSSQTAL